MNRKLIHTTSNEVTKKMTGVIGIALATAMLFSLTACKSKDEDTGETEESVVSEETVTAEEPVTDAETDKEEEDTKPVDSSEADTTSETEEAYPATDTDLYADIEYPSSESDIIIYYPSTESDLSVG